jgi:hypothetical protein
MLSRRIWLSLAFLACAATGFLGFNANSADAVKIKGGSITINTEALSPVQIDDWIDTVRNAAQADPPRYGLTRADAHEMVAVLEAVRNYKQGNLFVQVEDPMVDPALARRLPAHLVAAAQPGAEAIRAGDERRAFAIGQAERVRRLFTGTPPFSTQDYETSGLFRAKRELLAAKWDNEARDPHLTPLQIAELEVEYQELKQLGNEIVTVVGLSKEDIRLSDTENHSEDEFEGESEGDSDGGSDNDSDGGPGGEYFQRAPKLAKLAESSSAA